MRRIIRIAVFGLLLTGLFSVQAQEAAPGSKSRFGIVEGFWLEEATCELGVGWERIIFNWEQHQPTGPDDWYTLNVDDRWLKAADACDREVVALLKHTPAWATDGDAGPGVPRGLDLPYDDPGNVWGAFVRRTAEYYASRGVNHYIIWNEPDIDAETYGHEFSGELEDYFLMLKTAALAARSVNPAAVIHLAGTTYWHDVNEGRRPYTERLVERIMQDPEAAEHDYYFDVVSLHVYFRTETVYDIVGVMRAILDDAGLSHKEIWINEMNAAPTDDPAWPVDRPVYHLDLNQQADFLIQATALALAAEVERIAVYKLYDQELPAGAESFGIVSPPDASPRPAFYTWAMLRELLDDSTQAQVARTDGLMAVRIDHDHARQTLVAWARTATPQQISVEAMSNKAYLMDRYGKLTIIRPEDGQYRLTLRAAECTSTDGCFIGGRPLILIQIPGEARVQAIDAGRTTELSFD